MPLFPPKPPPTVLGPSQTPRKSLLCEEQGGRKAGRQPGSRKEQVWDFILTVTLVLFWHWTLKGFFFQPKHAFLPPTGGAAFNRIIDSEGSHLPLGAGPQALWPLLTMVNWISVFQGWRNPCFKTTFADNHRLWGLGTTATVNYSLAILNKSRREN